MEPSAPVFRLLLQAPTLVVLRANAADGSDERVLVVPVQGDAPPVEIACDPADSASCPAFPEVGNISWTWSPDDQFLIGILVSEVGAARYFLADPDTGRITATNWTGNRPTDLAANGALNPPWEAGAHGRQPAHSPRFATGPTLDGSAPFERDRRPAAWRGDRCSHQPRLRPR